MRTRAAASHSITGTQPRAFTRRVELWSKLLLVDEMPASILLPAGFVRFRAERFLLAVADRLDAARANARRDQSLLHSCCARISQRQVIFRRTALIAMSFNRDVDS